MTLQRMISTIVVRIIVSVVCLCVWAPGVRAATLPADSTVTASSEFLKLPIDVLDILPESTRFDMLVYFENDSVYHAPNALEGTSYLKTVTPDFLEVQITDVSSLQLKLLPTKKGDPIVMTLYTVGGGGQAPDTDIRFFTADLRELSRDRFFPAPRLREFFSIPKGSITTMKEIEQTVPFPTVEYSASASSTDVKAKLTVGAYMNQDDYNVIRLFEKPGISFVWNGSKYRLQKQ